jgi:iron(III) transport system permease protein
VGGFTTLAAISVLAALAITLPLLALAFRSLEADGGHWQHLWSTTLPELLRNSAMLGASVALGVAFLGAAPAWLVAQFDFPARRPLEWLLVLPLAIPAYVMAYAYTDALQYAGPVQTALRNLFGWQSHGDYWFPDIRSLWGAAFVLTLSLYPYVYVLARIAFLEQSTSLTEAGRVAGLSRVAMFWRASLPMARPAIAAGVTLALMETLADFGAVSYFGVPTFTTAIFKSWFNQGQIAVAAQLAGMLAVAAFACLWLEGRLRRRAQFHQSGGLVHRRWRIGSSKRWAATGVCALPCLLGFGLPVGVLIHRVVRESPAFDGAFGLLVANTGLLASFSAALIVALATMMAFAARRANASTARMANRWAALGYAIPGLVIAASLAAPFAQIDRALSGFIETLSGRATPLMLSGTTLLLVYAYVVRFLGVALQSAEAGLAKITPQLEDAARSLGASPRDTLRRVHVPMLRGSLATALLLVFVDVIKELPATLVLRPFNFDTLAVRTYTLAMDERLGEAALPALCIIAVALLPVLLASRTLAGARPDQPGLRRDF